MSHLIGDFWSTVDNFNGTFKLTLQITGNNRILEIDEIDIQIDIFSGHYESGSVPVFYACSIVRQNLFIRKPEIAI